MAMVTQCPKVGPKERFTTTATAALLGIDRTTLWNVSKHGKIRYHVRKDNGKRFYEGIDIMKYFYSESKR